MKTKEFNIKLNNMRIRKLADHTVFIHEIKGYKIWKVIVIDGTGKILSNFTYEDEELATEKFENIMETI